MIDPTQPPNDGPSRDRSHDDRSPRERGLHDRSPRDRSLRERRLLERPQRDRPTCDRRTRDRGQTVQDFAIGIGLFMLAVAFVFAFIPTVITPFGDAGGAETAQADRIAATIVAEADSSEPNNITEAIDSFDGKNESELAESFGLRTAGAGINVTVSTLDGETHLYASKATYDGQSGASATRIVTTYDEDCEPACKLTVRVWSS